MGALPSRETQRRGLYSHRHGRNRRNEVILIPLTAEFFPDPQCPLFRGLHEARHRRTAKYYYRSVRPASTDPATDYYCQTTAYTHKIDLQDTSAPNNNADRFETHFSDSLEGLYHEFVQESELCMCETDEELRTRYLAQLRQQQQHQHQQHPQCSSGSDSFGDPLAYTAGFADAMSFAKGKAHHTHRNAGGTRVTSPAAYHLRPVPCAIVSRSDPNRPVSGTGVEFMGSTLRVLGMFGLFPETLPISLSGEPSTEGNTHSTDTENVTALSHLLKATMFVDKEVGDQILGNVVMLAAHMYVRQCMEAKLRAPFIPMAPFILRTPISNVPMLQFVREMRVRLRTLLEAGTVASGKRPPHAGLSNAADVAPHGAQQLRQQMDAYLFEDDVPCTTDPQQLFMEESTWINPLQVTQNTNPLGVLPILMISGINVQSAPLKHSSLSSVAHVRVPAWAAEPKKSNNTNNTNNSLNNNNNHNSNNNGIQGTTTSNENSVNGAATMPASDPSRAALLLARRRRRFRIWVENGKLCVWASAAYVRRGCLLLAQQLAFTVDNNAMPPPRAWNYRGLLRGGISVPAPTHVNDVYIVACDMPKLGLLQGDLLRCCTAREAAVAAGRVPTNTNTNTNTTATIATTISTTVATTPHIAIHSASMEGTALGPSFTSPAHSTASACYDDRHSVTSCGSDRNYTSNHPSNVLLQPAEEAPPGAFWVSVQSGNGVGDAGDRATHHEDVLLAWIKAITIQTRDAEEAHPAWVLDPATGEVAHIDRYAIWRIEHDGVRYFIGITPRFLGQQRKAERERSREAKGHIAEEGEESGSEADPSAQSGAAQGAAVVGQVTLEHTGAVTTAQ